MDKTILWTSGRFLNDLPFVFVNSFRENLPIPIPIRNSFELISFTDTDSCPPSEIRPQNITDM